MSKPRSHIKTRLVVIVLCLAVLPDSVQARYGQPDPLGMAAATLGVMNADANAQAPQVPMPLVPALQVPVPGGYPYSYNTNAPHIHLPRVYVPGPPVASSYPYANDNPMSYIDPTGDSAITWIGDKITQHLFNWRFSEAIQKACPGITPAQADFITDMTFDFLSAPIAAPWEVLNWGYDVGKFIFAPRPAY